MARFSSELSGSLIFRSGSTEQTSLVPSVDALGLTGSLNVTGSDITFNGVSIIGRLDTLEAGGSGGGSILPLNQHSASINLFTSSINTFTGSTSTSLTALNSFTASTNAQITTINSELETVLTLDNLPAGTISSSQQISDLGYLTSASAAAAGFGDTTEIPAGTISSSAQISELGYITASSGDIINVTSSFATTASYISATNIDGTVTNATSASYSTTASYIDPTFISESAASFGFGDGGTVNYNELTNIPAGIVSGAAQISSLGFVTSSDADVAFNGDRVVSNDDFPSGIYNNNFGTSGSIQDFLNAVFFPNIPPTFTLAANQEVEEFTTSGSTLFTVTATDPEGGSLTFGTGSGYTDDFVRVSTSGVVTANTDLTSEAFNTDNRGDGTLAHPVEITVTDSFGTTVSQTYYIYVPANSAPVFRQTSVGGTIITSYNVNRNENQGTNSNIGRVYFTDANSDTITITTGSDPNGHFTLTTFSNYVQIAQVTSSLDYEDITSYTLSITASDEHYPAQDADSIATIPITITVVDNLVPTINNQTLSSINENSLGGAIVDNVAASDNESDSITYSNFTLTQLKVNGSDVPTGSYTGTSQTTDPHENPFQMNSSGLVTRKAGVFLNSDLIDEYLYEVTVKDNFNTGSNTGIVTVPVADDPAPSISQNGTFYVVESALSGSQAKTNSNGFSGTQARVTSNQTVTWLSNSSLVDVDSNGYITLKVDVSGSYTYGQTISFGVTASNSFSTVTTASIDINVADNNAATITYTNAGLDDSTAVSGSTVGTLTISDTESDTPYQVSLSGGNAGSFNIIPTNAASSSWSVQPTASLGVGTFSANVTATDSFGTVGSGSFSFDIESAPSLGAIYIYTSTRASGLTSGLYDSFMGIAAASSDVPPRVTSIVEPDTSPMEVIKGGYLGSSSISLNGGTMTLRATVSGSNFSDAVSGSGTLGTAGSTAEQIIVIFPSGSDMTGTPTRVTDSFGGSTTDEYVMSINADNIGFGDEATKIHSIDLTTSHLGFSRWHVIGRSAPNSATSGYLVRLTASSGSSPS